MICPTCRDSGAPILGHVLDRVWPDGSKSWRPCPDCIGGIDHCCGGGCAQPEPAAQAEEDDG